MKKTIKAYLDRIEEKIAVLYLGNKEEYKVDIPIKYLPKNIKENSRLKITFELEKTTDISDEIEKLRRKLSNN